MSKKIRRPKGAGSGGGPDTQYRPHYLDGMHSVSANQVEIIARPPLPPTVPDPPNITILADEFGTGGTVDVKGSQGVRISAGPPMLPPMSSASTNGVELVTGELQNITLQRGLIDGVDQKIEMAPGSITVDGGVGTITIQSLTEITLSVAGGLSTIRLTPAGIVLQGIIIQIN